MITQLPCSHFFHDACLMPWLDAKKTCPICRYEVTEAVPTVEELERFSIEELREKMEDMRDKTPKNLEIVDDDDGNLPATDKRRLAINLNKVLLDQKEAVYKHIMYKNVLNCMDICSFIYIYMYEYTYICMLQNINM
jgi:hypothetical protein